jgi:hypothetical protein
VTETFLAFSNIGVGRVFKSGSNGLNQAAKVASGKGGRKMPPIHRTYEKMSIDATLYGSRITKIIN